MVLPQKDMAISKVLTHPRCKPSTPTPKSALDNLEVDRALVHLGQRPEIIGGYWRFQKRGYG